MGESKQLSLTEASNFEYLLELLVPLSSDPSFAWLPELFSIIGYEKLLLLSRFAGGETIKIPTISQISESMEGLNWYYRVFVEKSKYRKSIPEQYVDIVYRIKEIIDNDLKREESE